MDDFSIQEYTLDLGRGDELFTSVVCSEAEFDNIVGLMKVRVSAFKAVGTSFSNNKEPIEMISRSRYIPLVWRGTSTEWVFEYFGVRSEVMGIITKGHGLRVAYETGLINKDKMVN